MMSTDTEFSYLHLLQLRRKIPKTVLWSFSGYDWFGLLILAKSLSAG